jgi:hypothetical protein
MAEVIAEKTAHANGELARESFEAAFQAKGIVVSDRPSMAAPVAAAPAADTDQVVELGRRGRQIKFTPERLKQIKNLVEGGKSRKEIAETVGVTEGSLQVTCSRLGISLRRPIIDNNNAGVVVADTAATAEAAADSNRVVVLNELAQRIREARQAAQKAGAALLHHCLDAGTPLTRRKRGCPRGGSAGLKIIAY